MKKRVISFLAVIFSLAFLTLSFAKDLGEVLKDDLGNAAKLSNKVTGTYFSPNAAGAFVISTVHDLGTKAFATGSMTTSIWEKSFTPDDNNSDQAIQSEPTSYSDNDTTSIFSGFTEK